MSLLLGWGSRESGAFWIICELYPPARVALKYGISLASDWQVSINPTIILENILQDLFEGGTLDIVMRTTFRQAVAFIPSMDF